MPVKHTLKHVAIWVVAAFTVLPSCTLFKPLPLEPFKQPALNVAAEQLQQPGINGNYAIMSADTSNFSLDYTFTYRYLFSRLKPPQQNDYIYLTQPDSNHIKATVFVNNKPVKTNTVKGKWKGAYFEFHNTRIRFRFIVNVFQQQSSRIWLTQNGDLYLDTNRGGIAFLIFLPVPLSGAQFDQYQLLFKRRPNNL